MRDQPTQSPKGVLDFLNDEGNEPNHEELMSAMDQISMPSTDLINPTMITGTNTTLLITFCEKLIDMYTSIAKDAMAQTLSGITRIHAYSKFHASLPTSSADQSSDPQPSLLLQQLTTTSSNSEQQQIPSSDSMQHQALYAKAGLTHAQNRLWLQQRNLAHKSRDEVDTILKVARSLLEVQRANGENIRRDVTALGKFTVSIKIIDGRWMALKQRYVEMAQNVFEIARAERMRLLADFQVEDPETGTRRSVHIDIDDLTERFVTASRARAATVEQEEDEESEDEEVEVEIATEDSEEDASGLDTDNEVEEIADVFGEMAI